MPKCPPVKDNLIPTLNNMGYMLAQPEALNQAFIDFAAQTQAPVLDIGCAYGVATIPALEKGATVFANDLEEKHLELLKSQVPHAYLSRLFLKVGRMPDEVDFLEGTLGAVLASRVLNFIHPTKLEETFAKIFTWLEEGGKFFYLGGSPWFGTYRTFLPQYEQNRKDQKPWPGFIENIREHASPERARQLPQHVTLLDQDEVEHLMTRAGFVMESLSYSVVDPENPPEMKLDGREYVIAVGVKK